MSKLIFWIVLGSFLIFSSAYLTVCSSWAAFPLLILSSALTGAGIKLAWLEYQEEKARQ